MKIKVSSFLAGSVLSLCLIGAVFAQREAVTEHGASNVYARLNNGVHVSLTTVTTRHNGEKLLTGSLYMKEKSTVSRVLFDEASGIWIGYDVEIEPLSDATQFNFTIKPLNPEYDQQLREKEWFRKALEGGSRREIITSLPLRVIADGDTIEIALMRDPVTGATITDRIRVSAKNVRP